MVRLLWILVLIVGGSFGAAALDDTRVAAAEEAGDAFVSRAAGKPEGEIPRRTDPEIARLLDIVFDRAILGSTTIPVTESKKLGQLLANANRVGLIYYLDGTGTRDLAKMTPDLLRRADRNIAIYAPELGEWLDFQIVIQTGVIGGALDFLARATPETLERPNVQSGLENVRQGMTRSVSGLIETITLPDLADEWRLARLELLMQSLDGIVRIATPANRETMRGVAQAGAERTRSPAVKAKLDEFARRIAPGPR